MKKIFSSYDLKIIGIVFMVIDHINIYLGSYLGLPTWIGFFREICRTSICLYDGRRLSLYKKSKKIFFKASRWWSTNVCHQY